MTTTMTTAMATMTNQQDLGEGTELAKADRDVLEATPSFRITTTGLITEGAPAFDEWSSLIGRLYQVRAAGAWALGDALNFGEAKYGKKYSQVLDTLSISYKTAANLASVARRVPSSRRREHLSFTHHEAIAALKADDGDRLLDEAEAKGWSARDLRDAARALGAGSAAKSTSLLRVLDSTIKKLSEAVATHDDSNITSMVGLHVDGLRAVADDIRSRAVTKRRVGAAKNDAAQREDSILPVLTAGDGLVDCEDFDGDEDGEYALAEACL